MNLKLWDFHLYKYYILSTFIISGIVYISYFYTPNDSSKYEPKTFSCGGGPFSLFMATLISTSCNRRPSNILNKISLKRIYVFYILKNLNILYKTSMFTNNLHLSCAQVLF